MKKIVSFIISIILIFNIAYADVIDLRSRTFSRDNALYGAGVGHGMKTGDNNANLFILLIVWMVIIAFPTILTAEKIINKLRKRETKANSIVEFLGAFTGIILIVLIIWDFLSKISQGEIVFVLGYVLALIPIVYAVGDTIIKSFKSGKISGKVLVILSSIVCIFYIVAIGIRIFNSIDLRLKLADFKKTEPQGYSLLIEDVKMIQREGTFKNAGLSVKQGGPLGSYCNIVGKGYLIGSGGSIIINGEEVYRVKLPPYKEAVNKDLFKQLTHDFFTSYLW